MSTGLRGYATPTTSTDRASFPSGLPAIPVPVPSGTDRGRGVAAGIGVGRTRRRGEIPAPRASRAQSITGHPRGDPVDYSMARQSWETDMGHGGRSYYLRTSDRIVFGPHS